MRLRAARVWLRMASARDQFAANLRERRVLAGLSQEALADRCNLHRTEISLVERNAGESVDHALRWIKMQKRNAARPFFFWLHLYDAHSPYRSPEPFA